MFYVIFVFIVIYNLYCILTDLFIFAFYKKIINYNCKTILDIINNKVSRMPLMPVRCFTCGKVVANKEKEYKDLLSRRVQEVEKGFQSGSINREDMIKQKSMSKGLILDDLGFDRYCCKRMFIGQPDDIVEIFANY